jgi:hypothetical protein
MENGCRLFHLEYDPADNARMDPVWNQFIASGQSKLVLGHRAKVYVLPNPGQQDSSQIALIRWYMKFHCRYTNVSRILAHPMVTNLDKPIKVSMVDGTLPPCKFTTLRHKYMDLCTSEGLPVCHAIMPRMESPSCSPLIDCLYLNKNHMAKDLAQKIAICPLAWWWHLFQMRGYTQRTATSLLDCFKVDCAAIADQSTFICTTGTVTIQFANTDDFLDRVELELGSDDDVVSIKKSKGGTPCPTSTFKLSEHVKASLASALNNPDMDLAANLHTSAKSCQTNLSSSTGNSTNCSVNTKQFALNHKERALALASKRKKSGDMVHKNKTLGTRIKELEGMLARGGPLIMENNPPADATSARTGIFFKDQMPIDNPSVYSSSEESEQFLSSGDMLDSEESNSNSEVQIVVPQPSTTLCDPSKTRLPASKDKSGGSCILDETK